MRNIWMKKIGCLVVAALIVAALVGCNSSSSKSYTFNVTINDSTKADQIKVTMDTSKGHSFTAADGGVVVRDKEGTFTMEGAFVSEDTYNDYVTVFNNPWEFDNITSTDIRTNAKGQSYYCIVFDEPGGENATFMFAQFPVKTSNNYGYVLFSCEKVSDASRVIEAFDLISFS